MSTLAPAPASAPHRAPARRPSATPTKPARVIPGSDLANRPSLSVVPPPAHRLHVLLAFGLLLVFVVLLATASLHTMLVAGQRDLDRVNNEIRTQTRANQQLELRVDEMESPDRIVEAARADGMIDPDEVTWLSPRPDGGAHESVTERPASPEADDETGDEPTDARASSESDGGDGGGQEGDGSGE